jgi:hypothetical protein
MWPVLVRHRIEVLEDIVFSPHFFAIGKGTTKKLKEIKLTQIIEYYQ